MKNKIFAVISVLLSIVMIYATTYFIWYTDFKNTWYAYPTGILLGGSIAFFYFMAGYFWIEKPFDDE